MSDDRVRKRTEDTKQVREVALLEMTQIELFLKIQSDRKSCLVLCCALFVRVCEEGNSNILSSLCIKLETLFSMMQSDTPSPLTQM